MKITREILKSFVDWTKLKVRIHTQDKKTFANEKEIWWASMGQNVGVEVNGKNDNFERPVVVIKKFNGQCLLVAPISSKLKTGRHSVSFVNHRGETNTINVSQIRTVSNKRFIRKVGKLEDSVFGNIKSVIVNIVT